MRLAASLRRTLPRQAPRQVSSPRTVVDKTDACADFALRPLEMIGVIQLSCHSQRDRRNAEHKLVRSTFVAVTTVGVPLAFSLECVLRPDGVGPADFVEASVRFTSRRPALSGFADPHELVSNAVGVLERPIL